MSDSLYERIFEETVAGMAVHEPETNEFVSVNDRFASALEYTPSALEGESLTTFAEGDTTALESAIERAIEGESEQLETRLRDGSGSTRQVTLELRSVGDEPRLLSTIRAVAETKPETASTPSKRRLEVALAGTDTGVWEWDMDTDEVIWTESMEQLFRVEPGTFEGTFEAFADRVHPDDIQRVQSAIETAIGRDELFETEYRITRDDGQECWVHARGEFQPDDDGRGRFIGIVTDITERKQQAEELQNQEQQYRRLVELLPQAHYTLDDEWRITFCNQAFANRLGRPIEEIQGTVLWELVPDANGSMLQESFRQVKESGEAKKFDYQYGSGEQWVTIQAYPYGDGIAAVSADISDQREALLNVLGATPIVIYRLDKDGVFREARGDMLSRLGIEPDDLIGESIFEAYSDSEQVTAAAKRALDGESFRYTVTLSDITLETNYTPVYTDGELSGVIGVSMDVTELQRQRDRMDFFNSILRHDVLNGMTVIKMRGELLAEQLEGEHAQYAQTIVDWCDTTTEVTKRVRRVIETLATPEEEHQLESVDISTILQRKQTELSNAYSAVEFETAGTVGISVQADELLADVVGNLLTNSIEHNDNDGLRIRTTVERKEDMIEIRIADNGVGISNDRKESVFRRGETSHAKETGSGFGLFFVDVMVEKYGGSIWIEDSETGGACFVLQLEATP